MGGGVDGSETESCGGVPFVWSRGSSPVGSSRAAIAVAGSVASVGVSKESVALCSRAVIAGEALAAAMESHCAIRPAAMKVEVTSPPFHFFVRFDSLEDCTRVVLTSEQVRCGGSRISFQRWSSLSRGRPSKLEYKTTLSLEGLPEEAWDPDTVNLVLAGVDGELIDMLLATNKRVLPCTAWLRNPSAILKVLTISVPAPPLQPWTPDSDDENAHSPPCPNSPIDRGTIDFPVTIHVKDVIDRGQLLTKGLPDELLPDEDADLSRKHTFTTWRGKIDGTEPGPYGNA
ncbi:hypothetical protein CFC21_100353 [Triticum aestivum]|uniref:DUF4283 domain-containing protein n=2 Tax=Triticum aestivum TaxID=4565 RepID=A0A9R1M1B0_WHEAT|nr:hypothetical protein CFC21_100353 [Triticum aestivum]